MNSKTPSLFDIFLSRKLLNLIMRDNVTVTKSQRGNNKHVIGLINKSRNQQYKTFCSIILNIIISQ